MTNHFEHKLSSEWIFKGDIITLKKDKIKLINGNLATREVVMHSGGAGVLAITEQNDVVLIRQFRYPFNETTLEIPAGKLNKGEEPSVCAKRELKEESGFDCQSLIPLGTIYPSPGYLDEVIYIYLAKGLIKKQPNPDPDEFVSVELLPIDNLVNMINSGEIKDAKTQIALLKYLLLNKL